ncbi:hypothetical protein [Ascidiimonas aurantiaca]|uniref:hypothetical protein n=1 Tax=Ascidiimonas aurantiaca TaxID=1685432 RepID=UPI0030EB8A94
MKFLSYINGLLFLGFVTTGNGQNRAYLKQTPPSVIPEKFAPNIISKPEEYEFGSVFNKDATEFFYGVAINGKEYS